MTQHTPGPIDWSTVKAPRAIAATWSDNPRDLVAAAAWAEIVRRWEAHEVMLEALRGVIGYLGEGAAHPDPCSSNPTWLSGADVEGPCDCYVGRVVAAIHAAEGK